MTSTDKSLLERLQENPDNSDWRQFNAIYRPFIARQVRRYRESLKMYSEDIAQDVLLLLIKEIDKFEWRQKGDFRSWLKVIVLRRIQSLVRKTDKRAPSGELAAWLADLEDPESDASKEWDRQHDRIVLSKVLERVKARVSEGSWKIFYDAFVLDKDAQGVAEDHSVAVVHVYNVKARLLKYAREEAEGLID